MPKTIVRWKAEETAFLKEFIAIRTDFAAAAVDLNAKFGTARTRKACSCHLYGLDHKPPGGPRSSWPKEHDDMLRKLRAESRPHSECAEALNEKFGTVYTRNACIGRHRRLDEGLTPSSEPRRRYGSPEEQAAASVVRKREKRWAENPSLKTRYERLQEIKRNRVARALDRVASSGPARVSVPSRQFRVSIPRPVAMTKGELRAMLTQIVLNTAAMEISP